MKGETEAVYSMRSIAPALLFVPIMAAFRGYFQGKQDMAPTASSQVVEQAFRVAFGLSAAVLLLPLGVQFAAAGASAGAAIGGLFGLLGIFIIFLRKRSGIKEECRNSAEGESESVRRILGRIVAIAVPVTIGAAIMPIMTNIDLFIVVRRLVESGYTSAEANSLYGQLSGFATPLINLPQVLTQAIAMSLVPAVAAAFISGDREFLQYNTAFGIRTAMIIGHAVFRRTYGSVGTHHASALSGSKSECVECSGKSFYTGFRCDLPVSRPDTYRYSSGRKKTDGSGDESVHRRGG